MFRSARIKLTAWYSLIIMLISASFSFAVYQLLSQELERMARSQRMRIERQLPSLPPSITPEMQNRLFPPKGLDQEVVDEVKQRIQLSLLVINLVILAGVTSAGYFLAGKTLRPIKEMLDDQNQFITDASHELRTPLTALKSEIEVTLRDKKTSTAELKKVLLSNLEEVNHLQTLSDGLITLTNVPANHRSITMAEISLLKPIELAIQKTAPMAKQKHIMVNNHVKDITIEGELASLTELLIIFIDNAIKYSPNNTAITISSEQKDGTISISIADQGIGIDVKDIPHLFDRFYRADKARSKTDATGYGLGLSIAKQIVDQYHGTITVESAVGVGSTFIVKLPIHQPKRFGQA